MTSDLVSDLVAWVNEAHGNITPTVEQRWRAALASRSDRLAFCATYGLPTGRREWTADANDAGEVDALWEFEHSRPVSVPVGGHTVVLEVRTAVPLAGAPRRLAVKLRRDRSRSFDRRLIKNDALSEALPDLHLVSADFVAVEWIEGRTVLQRLGELAIAATASSESRTDQAHAETRWDRLRGFYETQRSRFSGNSLRISPDRISLANHVADGVAWALARLASPHGALSLDHIMLEDHSKADGGRVVLLDPASWSGQPATSDRVQLQDTLLRVLFGEDVASPENERLKRLARLWEVLPAYAEVIEDLAPVAERSPVAESNGHVAAALRPWSPEEWDAFGERFRHAARVSKTVVTLEGANSEGFLNLSRLLTLRLRAGHLKRFIAAGRADGQQRTTLRDRAMWWSALAAIFFWLIDAALIIAFTWHDGVLGGGQKLSGQVLPNAINALYSHLAFLPGRVHAASFLTSRLLALSFAALAVLYYMNILSTLHFERIKSVRVAPLAELVFRLIPFLLNSVIHVGIFQPAPFWGLPRPWAVLTLVGMVPVLLCNFLLWRVVKAALDRGLFSADEKVEIWRSVREWWLLMAMYLTALLAVAVLLNAPHSWRAVKLRDAAFYAVLIGVVVNLGKLYGSNIRQLGPTFRGNVQRAAFLIRQWEQAGAGSPDAETARATQGAEAHGPDVGGHVGESLRDKLHRVAFPDIPIAPLKVFSKASWKAFLRNPQNSPRQVMSARLALGAWVLFVALLVFRIIVFADGAPAPVCALAFSFALLATIGYTGLFSQMTTADVAAPGLKRVAWWVEWQLRVLPITLNIAPVLGLFLEDPGFVRAPWALLMFAGMLPIALLNACIYVFVKKADSHVAQFGSNASFPALLEYEASREKIITAFRVNAQVMGTYVVALGALAAGLNIPWHIGKTYVLPMRDGVFYGLLVGLVLNWGKLYATNVCDPVLRDQFALVVETVRGAPVAPHGIWTPAEPGLELSQ